jgi:hypothetical protein
MKKSEWERIHNYTTKHINDEWCINCRKACRCLFYRFYGWCVDWVWEGETEADKEDFNA